MSYSKTGGFVKSVVSGHPAATPSSLPCLADALVCWSNAEYVAGRAGIRRKVIPQVGLGQNEGAAAHKDISVIPGLTRNPPWIRRLDTGFRQYDGWGRPGGVPPTETLDDSGSGYAGIMLFLVCVSVD